MLKNLNGLESSPPELKDKKPFDLLLEIAEIKQLTEEEMERYQVSLAKSYQLRSAINYAREEAREDEKMAIAIKLLMLKHPIDEIISLTELSREAVMSLIKKLPQALQECSATPPLPLSLVFKRMGAAEIPAFAGMTGFYD